MPTESMDPRSYSSSFFASSASRDVNFLNERQRQVGFWKSEQNYNNLGEPFVREKRTAIEYPIPKPVRHYQPLIPNGEIKPQYETSLFSSSLSDLFDRRSRFSVESTGNFHSVGNAEDDEPLESLEDIEAQTIGNLLPKEEDLLSDLTYQSFPSDPNNEDLDLFSSVGGMEMETERSHTPDTSDSFQKSPNIISRTLLIRNITSIVEDSDLKALFEPYGHIRSLYTASKNQGFVMVSYFDLRAAKTAMDSLLSRQRTLDIRYFSPKSPENNEGFVVIHDLDSSPTYIKKIFSVYGDIKEIREVQGRNNCKCIEYFDIRSAEAALLALNKDDFFKKQASFHRFSPSPDFCYGREMSSTGSTSLPVRNMNSNLRISPKFDSNAGGFHPSYRYDHPTMILPSSFRASPQLFQNSNYTGSAPTSNPSMWSTFSDSSSKNFFPNSGNSQRAGIFKSHVASFDERARRGRIDSGIAQADRRLYDLDLDRIMRGEDNRTTLMIKNIPNKYTSKMLLAAIDERHKGTYDFIYLPIDFKNKCNVGYAFINMIDPSKIISFYQSFNGKKWEKFNSEKVATLAYGRIQGKNALVAHFQNSSLMNEDKRCRPILFSTDGDQVPFPMGFSVRSRNGKPQGVAFDEALRGNSFASNSEFPFRSSSSLSQNEYVAC